MQYRVLMRVGNQVHERAVGTATAIRALEVGRYYLSVEGFGMDQVVSAWAQNYKDDYDTAGDLESTVNGTARQYLLARDCECGAVGCVNCDEAFLKATP